MKVLTTSIVLAVTLLLSSCSSPKYVSLSDIELIAVRDISAMLIEYNNGELTQIVDRVGFTTSNGLIWWFVVKNANGNCFVVHARYSRSGNPKYYGGIGADCDTNLYQISNNVKIDM